MSGSAGSRAASVPLSGSASTAQGDSYRCDREPFDGDLNRCRLVFFQHGSVALGSGKGLLYYWFAAGAEESGFNEPVFLVMFCWGLNEQVRDALFAGAHPKVLTEIELAIELDNFSLALGLQNASRETPSHTELISSPAPCFSHSSFARFPRKLPMWLLQSHTLPAELVYGER